MTRQIKKNWLNGFEVETFVSFEPQSQYLGDTEYIFKLEGVLLAAQSVLPPY